MSGAKKHTHKYRKLKSQIWACSLPDCTHYIPLNMIETIEGKSTICWSCEMPTRMQDKQLRMDKPICTDCILKLQGISITSSEAILEFINKKENEKRIEDIKSKPNSAIDIVKGLIDPLE